MGFIKAVFDDIENEIFARIKSEFERNKFKSVIEVSVIRIFTGERVGGTTIIRYIISERQLVVNFDEDKIGEDKTQVVRDILNRFKLRI